MKALAKEPEGRYQNGRRAARSDLLRFGRGQPVAALAEPTRVAAAVGGAAVGHGPGRRPDPGRRPWPGHPGPSGRLRRRRAGEPRRRPRRWWWWAALIAVLLALAVGLFFLGRALGWWDSTKTLTVPTDVVGKPAAAATTELRQEGFTNLSTRSETSSVTPGDVVTTEPPPGSRLRERQAPGPAGQQRTGAGARAERGRPDPAAATAALKDAGFVVN